ncbi:MAG: hypothetical protein GY699_01045 [Desulfobacteraceae bacterium]|nr:hypothetical protein [Desulfobacteraceae bacterium]
MDKKKFAAALAAVSAYIKTSEEALAYAAQEASDPAQAAVVAQPQMVMQQSNVWGISGRQTHMQANTMMQMRMFK